MVVFISYYTPEEYKALQQCADDPDELDEKWEDWLRQFIKTRDFVGKKFKTETFPVKVEEMQVYFRKNGLKNTAGNRASYVQERGNILLLMGAVK